MTSSIRWHDCRVAVLVEPKAEQYYQFELFLLTVREFSTLPVERITVHCLDGVSATFKDWVRAAGARVIDLAPAPEARYCAALMQLEQLQHELEGCEGVLLLDVRTLVLADIELPVLAAVCGKAAELPNPPLHRLERVFREAGVALPEVRQCDGDDGDTLAPLLASGFLFVPAAMANPLCIAWRDWMNWLLHRLHFFDNKKQRRLAGQVALALALARKATPYAILPSNVHLPVDSKQPLASYMAYRPVHALRYNSLDPFGFPVASEYGEQQFVAEIRALLGEGSDLQYFFAYKQRLAEKNMPEPSGALRARLGAVDPWSRRPRIILHTGPDSAATVELQGALKNMRKQLLERGVLYPQTAAHAAHHQWLVTHMLAEDEAGWEMELQAVIAQMHSGVHTVLLSAQGLFNHWWDFSETARNMLQALQDIGDVEVWIWLPEPAAYARELYLQNLANPPFPLAPSYGRDWSFRDTMQNPWFMRHFDYLGFVLEVQALLGRQAVLPMVAEDGMQAACFALLGIEEWKDNRLPVTRQWGKVGVDLLRTLNRHQLAPQGKQAAVAQLKALAGLPEVDGQPFVLAPDELSDINVLTLPGRRVLAARFGLQWHPGERDQAGSGLNLP